jgi:phosphoribosylformylglycinamidine cyclo-ligase
MTQSPISYRDAGVDIDAKEDALRRAKQAIRASFTPGVMADVGLFGGLFDPAKVGAGDTVLVASTDGVGTKLDVAKRARIYDTVGRDLVQHCINDLLCQGAYPLFFLDYVGIGQLDPRIVAGLIEGCAKACKDHGLALIGGETAEMPGTYHDGDFDLVGTIVGAVERENILDGSRVRAGQRLIGLASDGLHTNGYSLARKLIFERFGLSLSDRPAELGGRTVQEALLAPHRCYLKALRPLIVERRLAAWAHITGGGLPGNVNRVLGQTDAIIDRTAWKLPGLFELLTRDGAVERDEAFRAFNMGVGAVLLVEPSEVAACLRHLAASGEQAFEIGEVRPGTGLVRYSA